MPSAGAVIPPVITPLRKQIPGKPSSHVDTTTYIELDSETPDCKIYFTTDGSKPTPFQPKVGGREATFKYKGPFTLRSGKRTLKVIAVTRDGLKESNVITKTFQVADAGPPSDDIDNMSCDDSSDCYRSENDFKPLGSKSGPLHSSKSMRSDSKALALPQSHPKEAWSTPRPLDNLGYVYSSHNDPAGPITNSVQMPDGPFNPTNYSGTQVNFWGVAPSSIPAWANAGGLSMPYDTPGQLGSMTNRALKNMDQPRMSMAELKQIIHDEARQLAEKQPVERPPPVVEYVTKEPDLTPESPGNGNWKGQLEHIYAHLLNRCKTDSTFMKSIGQSKLGQIYTASIGEDDDGSILLKVAFVQAGQPMPKPKPKVEPKPPEPVKAPEPVKPPTPKPSMKDIVSKVKPPPEKPKEVPKEKPKPETKQEKQEKLKKRDPFFETEAYEAEGTLKPWPTFDAEIDSEKLRKAMKGIGTDEKAIIDVLGYRNCNQRMEVVKSFKTMFGKDLSDELDGELSGNFRSCCKALCLPPDVYDASEVKRAIKGLGTDEDALIEILCTRTNAQIHAINEAYKKQFNKDMEKDIVDDTSGNFKKLLVAQIQGNRDESPTFDRTAAQDDAQALFKAGEGKWGTDESTFNKILCERSFPHLRAVFDEYSKVSKKTIEDAIKSEFSGDIKNGLLTVVQVIKDKPSYFAQKMQKAMKGLGTDDQALVRIVVSRSESDMVQIKKSFETQFKGSLADWLKGDTSGDYREILLALVGDRAPPAASAEEIEAQGEPELEEVEEEHIEREGTLKPAQPFDPKSDCEALMKAMKGLGTDEKAIIAVMGHRAIEQRLEIVKMFKTMFGKDLIAEFKSELSGNLSHTITSLCKSPAEHDADELRKAMKGIGTDEGCLIEILCTRSNAQIAEITAQYQLMGTLQEMFAGHGKKLEDSIISETSGNIKRLLVSMLQANRPEGNTIDRKKARLDAKALHEAGEKKFGTDESRFNVILCSRSYPQLRATFEEYAKIAGKDIVDSINAEMSGDLKKGYLTIVGVIRGEAAQCAKTLYEAMHGLGTNDNSLIRTVVSRCEIDMVQIKRIFETNYKQPLGKYIADDTSGDYRKILLALVAEEQYAK